MGGLHGSGGSDDTPHFNHMRVCLSVYLSSDSGEGASKDGMG